MAAPLPMLPSQTKATREWAARLAEAVPEAWRSAGQVEAFRAGRPLGNAVVLRWA